MRKDRHAITIGPVIFSEIKHIDIENYLKLRKKQKPKSIFEKIKKLLETN